MSDPIPETIERILLAARPDGAPKPSDFRYDRTPCPSLDDGQFLVRIIWLSLDPYMRGRMDDGPSYAAPVEIGDVMEGGAVGEVIASRNPAFGVGDFVMGGFGWASHAISDGSLVRKLDPSLAPISTALGVLGMPGLTAWVGLTEHGRPKSGETLVVSAATGAVGSLVGQLGKTLGLRVVGIAGGTEKCDYARNTLGFDAAIDHRAAPDARSLRHEIARACPDGVDIYFENVGGKTLKAVVPLMNVHGRIPICGMISWYNDGGLGAGSAPDSDLMPGIWRTILVKRLNVRGFIITDHYDRFPEFLQDVSAHVRAGRITYRESIAEGLACAPDAFIRLLEGGNFGKQLVAVSPDPTLQS